MARYVVVRAGLRACLAPCAEAQAAPRVLAAGPDVLAAEQDGLAAEPDGLVRAWAVQQDERGQSGALATLWFRVGGLCAWAAAVPPAAVAVLPVDGLQA